MSTTFYAGGRANGDGRNCPFYGTELTPDRFGTGTCGALECHDNMIEESGKGILARKRAKHNEVSAEVFDMAADHIAEARQQRAPEALLWMISAQHEPLATLPAERLERFREHLGFCATMAFREPEEASLARAACATCRGRCCKDRGGDTALLLPNDFAWYCQRNPGVTEEQAIDAYLAHSPDVSTQDGCVYQGAQGCTLRREMRQDICNSCYCDPLRWLRVAEAESGTSEAVLVAAHKGVPERIAAVRQDGSR